MILKFKDLSGNWNFREGEITYRYVPITTVIMDVIKDMGLPLEIEEIQTIKKYEKELEKNTRELVFQVLKTVKEKYEEENEENFISFFEMMKQYIALHFDRADESIKIDTSGLLTQEFKSIYGLYFIEIVQPTLEIEYVLLNCGDAYLLSDSGKTVEKLI